MTNLRRFGKVSRRKEFLDAVDPTLPRRRTLPKKFDEPETYRFPSIPKELTLCSYVTYAF